MTTTFSDGASQLLNVPPAKRFNESISQNQREESLSQIVSSIYDHSNVTNDAIQDENRNPHVRDPGAQALGIEEVVPCPDIPEAPASPCNILHCEPISFESKPYLESPLTECALTTCSRTRMPKYIGCVPGPEGVLAIGIAGHSQS